MLTMVLPICGKMCYNRNMLQMVIIHYRASIGGIQSGQASSLPVRPFVLQWPTYSFFSPGPGEAHDEAFDTSSFTWYNPY